LQQGDTEDNKVYGRSVDTLVDLAGSIDKGKVVFVHKMLEDEVHETKGGDQGTRDAVHDHHGEKKKHSSILLTKPANKV
jgi:hypothetical protein